MVTQDKAFPVVDPEIHHFSVIEIVIPGKHTFVSLDIYEKFQWPVHHMIAYFSLPPLLSSSFVWLMDNFKAFYGCFGVVILLFFLEFGFKCSKM